MYIEYYVTIALATSYQPTSNDEHPWVTTVSVKLLPCLPPLQDVGDVQIQETRQLQPLDAMQPPLHLALIVTPGSGIRHMTTCVYVH